MLADESIVKLANYQREKEISREALHASCLLSGYQFLRPNFMKDLENGVNIQRRKLKRYKYAYEEIKDKPLEETKTLKDTMVYFEQKYSGENLDRVFPTEGVFSYRNISGILNGKYITTDVYDKILGFLLDFDDQFNE